jgi:hypothetical protein
MLLDLLLSFLQDRAEHVSASPCKVMRWFGWWHQFS